MFSEFGLEKLLLFTMVLSRISGLTMTAPIFGTKDVPMQVRCSAGGGPLVSDDAHTVACPRGYPGSLANYLLFIGSELIIGLCLGLGIVVLFSGLQVAGQLIGRTGGLMMANVLDPSSGEEVPLFSRLLFMARLGNIRMHRRPPHGHGGPLGHLSIYPARKRNYTDHNCAGLHRSRHAEFCPWYSLGCACRCGHLAFNASSWA